MKNIFNKSGINTDLKNLARKNITNGKPLSILDDAVFKVMLTTDSDDAREALKSLLSACIRRTVSTVRITNNELIPANLDAKSVRLDVHVTFNDGEAADLEMQLGKSADDLRRRAVYYAAMLLSGQSIKGKLHKQTKRIYQIFFLDFVIVSESNKIPRRYYYMEEEEHDRLTDVTEVIFYEMPKLEQQVRDLLEEKIELINLPKDIKWCIYFKYRHVEWANLLIKKLCSEEEGIMRAENTLTKVDRSYRKFARNLARAKNELDRQFDLENAIEKKAVKIAQKMLANGFSVEQTAFLSELDVEKVKELENNL